MSINILFAIIGGVFLGGAIGLFIAYIKYDESLVSKLGKRVLLHLGLIVCCSIGIACIILAHAARECPNCDIVVKGNYCEECGYQVRAMEYQKKFFCSECGDDINIEANICGQCGKKVKEREK